MPIRRTTRIGHATGQAIHDGEIAIGGHTGLPIVPSGSKTYESYINSLNPLLWLAMTATGATEVNKGTVGATLDGTIANIATQAVAGKIAADSAHLYNADDSVITVPNDASIQPDALGAFTWVAICIPFSLGASTKARLSTFPISAHHSWRIQNADDSILVQLEAAVTNAVHSITFSSRFVGKPTVFFMTFDVAIDNFPLVYRYDADGFEEGSTVSSTNISGALSTPDAVLEVGNSPGAARGFPGLYDEFMIFGSVLPAAQMERIGRLAMARRWNSYITKLQEIA